jgi:hypothetical protein
MLSTPDIPNCYKQVPKPRKYYDFLSGKLSVTRSPSPHQGCKLNEEFYDIYYDASFEQLGKERQQQALKQRRDGADGTGAAAEKRVRKKRRQRVAKTVEATALSSATTIAVQTKERNEVGVSCVPELLEPEPEPDIEPELVVEPTAPADNASLPDVVLDAAIVNEQY